MFPQLLELFSEEGESFPHLISEAHYDRPAKFERVAAMARCQSRSYFWSWEKNVKESLSKNSLGSQQQTDKE